MCDIRVSRLGSRDYDMLYYHNLITNIGMESAVYIISHNFNKTPNLCDSHIHYLKNILTVGFRFFAYV